jgi:hypothetical protein
MEVEMAHMLIRHKVQDFGKWKPAYDAHQPARAAAGLKDLRLWRNADDPNDIFLLFEAADVAKAKAFAASADLKEKMTSAGVIGQPEIFFLSGD